MAGRMAADQGAALSVQARAPAVALHDVSITFRLADGGELYGGQKRFAHSR